MIEGIFFYVLTELLDPIKGFILNKFTSQNFPINDFLAAIGISAIVGATAIAVLLILQLRNYLVNKSLDIVINEKSANEKLDDLIEEIENFNNKWQYTNGIISSYKRQIDMNSIGGDRKEIKKIIQYSSNMYIKINSVKKLGVPSINNILDSILPTVDNLVLLGSEIKSTYWSIKKSKIIVASEPQIKSKLLSNGDKICIDLDSAVVQLRLHRKYLP